MKRCARCFEKLPLELFHRRVVGHSSWCVACVKDYMSRPSAHRKAKYGLSGVEFNRMLWAQDYRCAICDDTFDDERYPCVDHCHATGKVRSLLCNGCNAAIGFLKDDPDRCTAAAKYLIRWGELSA